LFDREIDEKELEDSTLESKHEKPLLSETVNPENSEDDFGPPWMISPDFGKDFSGIGIGSEELKIIDGYFQVPLKCKGNLSVSDCLCEKKKTPGFQKFWSSTFEEPTEG